MTHGIPADPLSQALVPELAEEGETEAQAEWRHVYTSQWLPAPRLGPVTAKRVAGEPEKQNLMVRWADLGPPALLAHRERWCEQPSLQRS
jgi:hypothetical protein